ncbi:unnamed protein product, partial [Allacma fusca]
MIIKLQRSKDVLLRLAVDPDGSLSMKGRCIIKDDGFWSALEELKHFLLPVFN